MIDIVLRIGWRVDGTPTPVDGKYIVDYDPRLDRRGVYRLDTTSDINRARGFSRVAEAFAFIRQPCPNIPEDSPGHVNRPITAYHIEVLPRVTP